MQEVKRLHNIDIRSRLRQFLFLLAATTIGMIMSSALFAQQDNTDSANSQIKPATSIHAATKK